MGGKAEYIGEEAMSKKGILKLEYPIDNGIVRNWDGMAALLTHTFYNELRTSPEEHPVLMTDSDRDPKVNKEKLAEILFEKLRAPSIFLVNPGILALYANAMVTGTAVDCGDCVTLCVPGNEGMADTKAIRKKYFGGRHLTNYLTQLLNERDNLFTTSGEQYIVKTIKEETCYVVLDPATVSKSAPAMEFRLPDGKKISLDRERWMCPEVLFTPVAALGKEEEGLSQFVLGSIMKCEEALRGELFSNIVLAGGSTVFPGLPERLQQDLVKALPEGVKVEVKAPKNRKYSSWIGGSILTTLSTFRHMWLSKAEYQDGRGAIVASKFPV